MRFLCIFFLVMALNLAGSGEIYAFGNPSTSGVTYQLLGKSLSPACAFEPRNDPSATEAEIVFHRPGAPDNMSAGGTYYLGGSIQTSTGGPIMAGALASDCDFSSVTIISQNGADSTYAADNYIGIVFEAITNGDTATYRYEVALAGATSTTFIITRALVPGNTPPTANAGPDQSVASGAAVSLDGSGSSANDAGQSLTYAWTQTGGMAVSLVSAATSSPGFTAPTLAAGAPTELLTFELVVNDGIVASAADSVEVSVSAPTAPEPAAPPPGAPGTPPVAAAQPVPLGAHWMLWVLALSLGTSGMAVSRRRRRAPE
ncbi:PKD domain-containing protein [Haliea sp. E17]|uniref:PKD domain-containing protein n=1 Tax=Haliea sp. E17 TaxID=3401576 RepID=UPI003AB07869